MFNTIMVAVDGSDHSDAAIRHACDLADKYGSTLHFVHVPEVDFSAIAVGSGAVVIPVSDEKLAAAGAPVIAGATALAKTLNAEPTSTTIAQGDPAKLVLAEAAARNVDLIVSGRRGLGKLSSLLLGSVSQKISSDAPCAVLTVK